MSPGGEVISRQQKGVGWAETGDSPCRGLSWERPTCSLTQAQLFSQPWGSILEVPYLTRQGIVELSIGFATVGVFVGAETVNTFHCEVLPFV